MSSSIVDHSHFEELYALAAVGQVSSSEYEELSHHLRECICCRESYDELLQLTHAQLPLGAAQRLPAPKPVGVLGQVFGKDYKARFVARARERGLEISGSQVPEGGLWARLQDFSVPQLWYQRASIVVILALLTLTGILSHRWKAADGRAAAVSAQVSKLSQQNLAQQQQMEALSEHAQSMETNLLRKQADSGDLIIHLRQLEEQVKESERSVQSLEAQLSASNGKNAQTEQRLQEAQQKLVAVNQEVAELRASHADHDATFAAEQAQEAELSRRVKGQEEVIDKQQKLLSVDTDVRNLMAARNLHITDVFDVDGKGRKKKAFGRVFYTEGRSLIFYAFDLDAPQVAGAKHSFQAWGQRSDSPREAVNLGIFYVDDPAQKRWMLKFDNPAVLDQISAVFVTAEPHGGVARPTGQKLMYAYLGHEPNHP